MVKILFICHGNICRSPMGEFIFKDMVQRRGVASLFEIASAATSREEIGNPVYPPARRELQKHGISCAGKTARQVTLADYAHYDYLLYMESYNFPRLMRVIGGDPERKCFRVMDFSPAPCDIDDPWYTGDFSGVFAQLTQGCQYFLKYLEEKHEL